MNIDWSPEDVRPLPSVSQLLESKDMEEKFVLRFNPALRIQAQLSHRMLNFLKGLENKGPEHGTYLILS